MEKMDAMDTIPSDSKSGTQLIYFYKDLTIKKDYRLIVLISRYGCRRSPSTARALTELFIPLPSADQELPFHLAILLTTTPLALPKYPPDLDCGDITFRRFQVTGSDSHGFDRVDDGIGCESD